MSTSPIIIPLDGMTESTALAMAKELSGSVWGFKVNDLLIECGVSIVTKLKKYGNVFADPKLHDIPNTVSNSVQRLDEAGADFISIHASGWTEMMEAAVQATSNSKILAITILTSLDDEGVDAIYHNSTIDQVLWLAEIAKFSKVHGVVCSPMELELLEEIPELIKVIPGIRPKWYLNEDDQKRVATPENAMKNGADLLVIGRPITSDKNPYEAAQRTMGEIVDIHV